MSKNLLVSNDIYYQIDSLFYKENNFKHLSLDISYNDKKDFNLIINSYNFFKSKNTIVILDDVMFDNILKTSDPYNCISHKNNDMLDDKELFFKNYSIFFAKFPKNTKFILYDNTAEASQPIIDRYIIDWLEMNPYNYFISSRFCKLKHRRAIVSLIYLPIIYSFYLQDFYNYPMLEFSSSTNPKYDFVTYLGHTSKTENISFRYNFLKTIFGKSINKVKYKDLNLIDNENLGNGKKGHLWNLLNSLTAKIQIIFETSPPTLWHYNDFLTEKTMKCFLLPHPYILLVHRNTLEKLEEYGFSFPIKCATIDEYKNEINYVNNNIEEWVNKFDVMFHTNQINFYKLINSTILPHHIFLKNILK